MKIRTLLWAAGTGAVSIPLNLFLLPMMGESATAPRLFVGAVFGFVLMVLVDRYVIQPLEAVDE